MNEFPVWVPAHESHLVRRTTEFGEHLVTAKDFTEIHLDRVTKTASVLCQNEDDRQRAMADWKQSPMAISAMEAKEAREVHDDFERIERDKVKAAAKEKLEKQETLLAAEAKRRATERKAMEAKHASELSPILARHKADVAEFEAKNMANARAIAEAE